MKAKVEIIPDYFGEKRLQATPVFNKKKKKKKTRKPWSHIDIHNLKSKINLLGKQLKKETF